MKYLVMIYCDDSRLGVRPEGKSACHRGGCLNKTTTLRARSRLLDSQRLDAPAMARTVRVREGRVRVDQRPFHQAEAHLVDTHLVEAADMEEAALVASSCSWARTGVIEIRPVRNVKLLRQRAGA
ncbi:MAG: YciI family protein [Rhodanobacter sp.]